MEFEEIKLIPTHISNPKADLWIIAGQGYEEENQETYLQKIYFIVGNLALNEIKFLPRKTFYDPGIFDSIPADDMSKANKEKIFYYKFLYVPQRDVFLIGTTETDSIQILVPPLKQRENRVNYCAVDVSEDEKTRNKAKLTKPSIVKSVNGVRLRGFCLYTTKYNDDDWYDTEKTIKWPPNLMFYTNCGTLKRYDFLDNRLAFKTISLLKDPEPIQRLYSNISFGPSQDNQALQPSQIQKNPSNSLPQNNSQTTARLGQEEIKTNELKNDDSKPPEKPLFQGPKVPAFPSQNPSSGTFSNPFKPSEMGGVFAQKLKEGSTDNKEQQKQEEPSKKEPIIKSVSGPKDDKSPPKTTDSNEIEDSGGLQTPFLKKSEVRPPQGNENKNDQKPSDSQRQYRQIATPPLSKSAGPSGDDIINVTIKQNPNPTEENKQPIDDSKPVETKKPTNVVNMITDKKETGQKPSLFTSANNTQSTTNPIKNMFLSSGSNNSQSNSQSQSGNQIINAFKPTTDNKQNMLFGSSSSNQQQQSSSLTNASFGTTSWGNKTSNQNPSIGGFGGMAKSFGNSAQTQNQNQSSQSSNPFANAYGNINSNNQVSGFLISTSSTPMFSKDTPQSNSFTGIRKSKND